MADREVASNEEPLIPAAERLVQELKQTEDPEAKLLILSRAWGVMQAIISELRRRVEADEAVGPELERVQALAASFEAGSRSLAQVLQHELEDASPN